MKNVTRARLDPGPSGSLPNRALSLLELATSFADERGGMISPDEGIDRVFRAAIFHGCFRVNWNVNRGRRKQFETRAFPEAVFLFVRLVEEGFNPLMYAAIVNRDALLSARSHKDDKTGKWIRKNQAVADELQRFMDIWCSMLNIENKPAPILARLRKFIQREQLEWPKRKIARERLPVKSSPKKKKAKGARGRKSSRRR